jgi:hypothetical protein
MKNYFSILGATILLFTFSCQSGEILNEKAELTEEKKEAIKNEIQQLFEFSGEGIRELDAEKTFSVFSKKEGVKYIRNGYLYPNIETAQMQYAEWFAGPEAVKRKITADPVFFDILDENTVLLTAIGSAEVIGSDSTDQPWILAYTMLWRKEESGWKLFHMHNSWE